MPVRLLALLTLLAALLAAPAASAQTATCDRYASPSGTDDGDGSVARPLRTVPQLVATLTAGMTGCLREGTYAESRSGFIAKFTRGGTADAPITLRSHPGERARVVGIIAIMPGANHVHLDELDVEGIGESNTIKVYAEDAVVEDSDITNEMRGESCLMLGNASVGRAVRTVVRRNFFHDCGALANDNHDHSIYAAQADDGEIVDNVFSNSAAYTIQLYPSAQRFYVARNVIDGGPDTIRGGIVIGGDTTTASSGNLIEHNVIAHTATQAVFSYWPSPVGSDNLVRDNCFWKNNREVGGDGGLAVAGNVVADPKFSDRAARDYRLGGDSPCASSVQGAGIGDSDVIDGGLVDSELADALEIDALAFVASSSARARGPVGCAGKRRPTSRRDVRGCRSRR